MCTGFHASILDFGWSLLGDRAADDRQMGWFLMVYSISHAHVPESWRNHLEMVWGEFVGMAFNAPISGNMQNVP